MSPCTVVNVLGTPCVVFELSGTFRSEIKARIR